MDNHMLLTLETLKLEQEQDDSNQSSAQITTTNISFPNEIIQEILSRLPVKPILQFRSVSKQWLSFISHDPSFPKLHFNRSLVTNDRTFFFISAYDSSTKERHFLSAPRDGGPVTHLVTLHNASHDESLTSDTTHAEHLNGLVLFTSRNPSSFENFAFVINPATRKVFKVPPPFNDKYSSYFFGFDDSNNEHKILSISYTNDPNTTIEYAIFSLSTYSWRKISVVLEELPPVSDILLFIKHSVCAKSVIHLMVYFRCEILAFDLKTEKFSIIELPEGAIPREVSTRFTWQGKSVYKTDLPFLIKDNELFGVVCHDNLMETKEMHIWILQDYENRVWVRETVKSSESWIQLNDLGINCYFDMSHRLFSCRRLSKKMVNAFILDMKTKCFKSVDFKLGYPFLRSKTVKFRQVRSCVESILPLREG